jgi:AbrB family looped-hinge helix DNA binding protein
MRAGSGSVSPKGQVTIPREMRQRLGLKPKDRVVFRLEGDSVRMFPVRSWLKDSYQAVPALDPSRPWDEIEEIAHEDHALHAAREGLEST